MLEAALVENLQREDLNPLEAAEAYARLREEFALSQELIADRVGKDRATIANSLRILKLPVTVRDRVRSGSLSGGHAKALAALASPDDQEHLAEEIVRRSLSVRQTEKRVAHMHEHLKSKSKEILQAIVATGKLEKATEEALNKAIAEFKQQFEKETKAAKTA